MRKVEFATLAASFNSCGRPIAARRLRKVIYAAPARPLIWNLEKSGL